MKFNNFKEWNYPRSQHSFWFILSKSLNLFGVSLPVVCAICSSKLWWYQGVTLWKSLMNYRFVGMRELFSKTFWNNTESLIMFLKNIFRSKCSLFNKQITGICIHNFQHTVDINNMNVFTNSKDVSYLLAQYLLGWRLSFPSFVFWWNCSLFRI